MPSFAEYRLPPGRHGIPREQVRANQRWRLIGACAEVLAERGYDGVTVAAVAGAAGVSKTDFYRHFPNLPKCFLATHEAAAEAVVSLMREACAPAPGAEPVLSAVSAILGLFVAEPGLARVLCDPALAEIPDLYRSRLRLREELALLLASAHRRPEVPRREQPAPLDLFLIEGACGWLHSRLLEEESSSLPARGGELIALLNSHPQGEQAC